MGWTPSPADGTGTIVMRTSTALYPFDVVGDPEAVEAVVALGVDEVSLAGAYHAVRAVTPRHPQHRIVTAQRSAVYYVPDAPTWSGRYLQPSRAEGEGVCDSFGPALDELRAAGLGVNAWVVLAHSCGTGGEQAASHVTNAFGDSYPWALCIARPEVVEYAATLAGEIVGRFAPDGVELEACGWYGFDHLNAHDKVHAEQSSAAERYLLSVCFCEACEGSYRAAGIDLPHLREVVAGSLRDGDGRPRPDGSSDSVGAEEEIRARLGADLADALLCVRLAAADRMRRAVVSAVRAAARGRSTFLWLHAQGARHGVGGNVGVDPSAALSDVDGLLYGAPSDSPVAVAEAASVAREMPGRRVGIVVDVLGTQDDGGARLAKVVGDARDAGATDLHLYHAGLASADGRRILAGLVNGFGS